MDSKDNEQPENRLRDVRKGQANQSESSGVSLLASARDLAFVLAILAFFTSFEYRYYYYRNLGIPTSQFSAADSQMLVGSYSVLVTHWGWVLLAFALITAATIALNFISGSRDVVMYQRLFLVLIMLLAFPILDIWSQETARKLFDELTNRSSGTPTKPIIVTFTNKGSQITSAMQAGCVELITQSSDALYVLVRQKVHPYVYVDSIPTRAIAYWITPLDYPRGHYAKRCVP